MAKTSEDEEAFQRRDRRDRGDEEEAVPKIGWEEPESGIISFVHSFEMVAEKKMTLDKTYSLADDPPPPMTWEDYEKLVMTEWNALLSGEQNDEGRLQTFLEQHPCLLPGAFMLTVTSGHSPLGCGVVTQPVLPDYSYHVPDFMWLSKCSAAIQPVLIEIEAPGKRWFTKSGHPTANLTQAKNQLERWRTWFGDPLNVQKFRQFYEIDGFHFRDHAFDPVYVLIYGRREEVNSRTDQASTRHYLQGHGQTLMTFDRLKPDRNCSDLWCVRRKPGSWEAVSIPPTTRLGPAWAFERAEIAGREEAIRRSAYISESRKEFLIERLKYWDKWATMPDRGVMNLGDCE